METYILRHLLATLSYRTTLALKDAPAVYPDYELGNGVRKPIEILNHMTNLLGYISHCYTNDEFQKSDIGSWSEEVDKFYSRLEQVDRLLQQDISPAVRTISQLVQGPFADALTHVGQLLILRRMAGAETPYENFMDAKIEVGQLRPKN